VTEASHAASRALDDLYRAHGADVYRYALAVLGNHADAEDVTQTTFLNAYGALEQGVRPRKPANWLLTIASNAIKQRFRRDQARPREVELDREPAASAHESDVPSVGELLTALSKIPPQQRQAIVLREFEGRSYNEIADILGVTTSALETLLFRARRSLTDELSHQLTCTQAQQAISRAADRRLGRKERRRLQEHVRECPDCAQFARLQQRHSKALRGLALVPVPLSVALFKGFEGSAAAATVPVVAGSGVGATAVGVGAVGAGSSVGGSAAGGGGLLAGGLAVKAAAVVAAAGVAGGVTAAGVKHIAPGKSHGRVPPSAEITSQQGKSHVVHSQRANHASGQGLVHGKAVARGQMGNLPPGQLTRHDLQAKEQKASHGLRATGHAKGTPVHHSRTHVLSSVPKTRDEPTPKGHAYGRGKKPSATTPSATDATRIASTPGSSSPPTDTASSASSSFTPTTSPSPPPKGRGHSSVHGSKAKNH
jgi:RNA polymerase sigma factor (sigma-70 family)